MCSFSRLKVVTFNLTEICHHCARDIIDTQPLTQWGHVWQERYPCSLMISRKVSLDGVKRVPVSCFPKNKTKEPKISLHTSLFFAFIFQLLDFGYWLPCMVVQDTFITILFKQSRATMASSSALSEVEDLKSQGNDAFRKVRVCESV